MYSHQLYLPVFTLIYLDLPVINGNSYIRAVLMLPRGLLTGGTVQSPAVFTSIYLHIEAEGVDTVFLLSGR